MCKGKPPGPVVQTIQAGETINVAFEGSAKHGGVSKECRCVNCLIISNLLVGNLSILSFL